MMKHQDVLAELGLTPARTAVLTGQLRARVLNFLLRWEHLDQLHACLDVLIAACPTLVSLLDLRVRAFLAANRSQDALPVMEKRLEFKSSLTARALLARVHLAEQNTDAALQMAQTLVEESGDSLVVWSLMGEVGLALGNTSAALDAYRHLNELSPQSRAYLLGMIGVYQAQGDWVTASGYAVRLLRTATDESPLPVSYLRQLRDYFLASGEGARVVELGCGLGSRYTKELVDLREALSPGRSARPCVATRPESVHEGAHVPTEPLPVLEQIPVSAAEQARILRATRQFFGFETLLPGQLQALACALRGEDVLTILPTGGGKSLCYQLPAMLDEHGTTLVISPLIALMKDQIDSLPVALRSRATTINSSLEGDELRRRLAQLAAGAYRLVYVAPERLRQPGFLHTVRKAGLNRLVIDEAHCVSVWGHDFRPDYLTIGQVRENLGNPPLLALTATAPPRVRRDILGHLGDMRVVAGDVTRPNLTFEVFCASNTDAKLRRMLDFCAATSGSGIVYVDTRAHSEELAALLHRYSIVADHYHAGIPDRERVQDDFMSGRTRVVVATIAFGMGIDKPDIRFIVHAYPPRSLEAYYQEAGRAGRDGQPAHCLLMYAPTDRGTLTRRSRQDLLTVSFLRTVYAVIRHRLKRRSCGTVVRADLERELKTDDTRVRVALSFLEEAGLLRCGPDVPRMATVCLRAGAPSANDAAHRNVSAFESFCQAARLCPEQTIDLNLLSVARETGMPPGQIENQILQWADAGWMGYHSSGHDLLIELLPPPQDAAERVDTLIERYEAIAVQRVDEIVAYAQTQRCRHGHINSYLGGRTIEQCGACDNCTDIAPPQPIDLPDEHTQLLTVLRCIAHAPWGGWGRQTLVRTLRGGIGRTFDDRPLHGKAREQAEFGTLAFRSQTSVGHLIDRLLHNGFLRERKLEHGGIVMELAPAGQAALQNPAELNGLLTSTVPHKASSPLEHVTGPVDQQAQDDHAAVEVDEALLEKLREWRRAQAREDKVAPFVVFHDRHLWDITSKCPTTLEKLSEAKGVGEVKLAKYGKQLVELIRTHLDMPLLDVE